MNLLMPNGEQAQELAFMEMNEVHAHELGLIRHLMDQLESGDTESISIALQSWLDHTVEHFDNEYRLMDLSGFPPITVHDAEHQRAMDSLIEMQKNWIETKDPQSVKDYILKQWNPWFENHLASMDFVTAQFLVNNL